MLLLFLLIKIIGAFQVRDFEEGPFDDNKDHYNNVTIEVPVTQPQIISLTKFPFWSKITRQFHTESQGFLVQIHSLDFQCDQLELFIQTETEHKMFCDDTQVPIFVAFFKPKVTLFLAKRKVSGRDIIKEKVGFNLTISAFDSECEQYENVKQCGDFCIHQSVTCPNCLKESGHCEITGKKRGF